MRLLSTNPEELIGRFPALGAGGIEVFSECADSWDGVEGIRDHVIFYSTACDSWVLVERVARGGVSCSIIGLIPGRRLRLPV